MTGNNNQFQDQQELLSTALRYVLDEMPSAERAEFECRLLDEQAAREAVAETVALCQLGKETVDRVMQGAEAGANWRPHELVEPVRPAARVDRAWRAPVRWAAMAVAAGIIIAAVLTGLRKSNQTERELAALGPFKGTASETDGVASRADGGKQLAIAWLNFLPAPNDVALSADGTLDTDKVALNGDMSDGDEESDVLSADENADEDIVARVETTGSPAGDWVFEAVTALPAEASSETASPQEG